MAESSNHWSDAEREAAISLLARVGDKDDVDLVCGRNEAIRLLQKIGLHLDNLADAFRRGALTDHEGKIGPRSYINNDLLREVEKFLGGGG